MKTTYETLEIGSTVQYGTEQGVVANKGYGTVFVRFNQPVYKGSYNRNFGGLAELGVDELELIAAPPFIVLQKGDLLVYRDEQCMRFYDMQLAYADSAGRLHGTYGEVCADKALVVQVNGRSVLPFMGVGVRVIVSDGC